MNTREALEKSILLWDWLADNPGEHKHDGLFALFPGEPRPLNNCFLCESVSYVDDDGYEATDCTRCPVWPNPYHLSNCEEIDSPYSIWLDNKCHESAARDVANLCRKALWRL
jgi:hypothetical protein